MQSFENPNCSHTSCSEMASTRYSMPLVQPMPVINRWNRENRDTLMQNVHSHHAWCEVRTYRYCTYKDINAQTSHGTSSVNLFSVTWPGIHVYKHTCTYTVWDWEVFLVYNILMSFTNIGKIGKIGKYIYLHTYNIYHIHTYIRMLTQYHRQ